MSGLLVVFLPSCTSSALFLWAAPIRSNKSSRCFSSWAHPLKQNGLRFSNCKTSPPGSPNGKSSLSNSWRRRCPLKLWACCKKCSKWTPSTGSPQLTHWSTNIFYDRFPDFYTYQSLSWISSRAPGSPSSRNSQITSQTSNPKPTNKSPTKS